MKWNEKMFGVTFTQKAHYQTEKFWTEIFGKGWKCNFSSSITSCVRLNQGIVGRQYLFKSWKSISISLSFKMVFLRLEEKGQEEVKLKEQFTPKFKIKYFSTYLYYHILYCWVLAISAVCLLSNKPDINDPSIPEIMTWLFKAIHRPCCLSTKRILDRVDLKMVDLDQDTPLQDTPVFPLITAGHFYH